jgi:hypothetical protein
MIFSFMFCEYHSDQKSKKEIPVVEIGLSHTAHVATDSITQNKYSNTTVSLWPKLFCLIL